MTAATHVGPYRLIRPLGRGGMGVVHLAEAPGTSSPVAVKTVRASDPATVASIRREVRALARLGHPGIVRILAEGVDGGIPWYAMELLEGATLRAWALGGGEADAGTVPDVPSGAPTVWWTRSVVAPGAAPGVVASPAAGPRPLAEILGIVSRLCEALSYLHGEGIVHRDLKPDNVVVRSDGLPVLLDFGLVARFGGEVSRDVLELTDPAGTLAYMAPEQARGEPVDARADLYALGCVLHELLVGEPPFPGDTPAAILWRHLEERPVSVCDRRPELPGRLGDLVDRLLAKEPRARLGHADLVGRALLDLGAAGPRFPTAPPPRPYLYRPGMAGRDEVRERAEAFIVAASRPGERRVAILSGESGLGKTRLLAEVGAGAGRHGMLVLAATCPASSPPPLSAFVAPLASLADRARAAGEGAAARLFGAEGKILAAYEPSVGTLPGVAALPEPVPLAAEEARQRVLIALGRVLSRASAAERLLLLLDDVQDADELSLDALALLARGAVGGGAGPVVLAAARAEEADERLRRIVGLAGVTEIRVRRLDDAAVTAMMADMLAGPAPPGLASLVVRHAEGNPFFVAEYLRAAVADGLLARDETGSWRAAGPERTLSALPVPRSVHELVARRLDGIPPRARGVASMASVIGRTFDAALLGSVLPGGHDEGLHDDLSLLAARLIVEEEAAGSFRFAHERIRLGAYGLLDATHRVEAHRRVAVALEAAGGEAAALGHHWEQAGDAGRARAAYVEGARSAGARHALRDAARLYRAALALGDDSAAARAALLLETAESSLDPAGLHREALVALEEALALARGSGDGDLSTRILLREAHLRRLVGPVERAEQIARDVAARDGVDGSLRAAAEVLLGRILVDRGASEAVVWLERGRRGHLDLGEQGAAAEALAKIALLHLMAGRFDVSERCFREALEDQRRIGDRRGAALTHGDLAALLYESGRVDEAAVILEETLKEDRELGMRRSESIGIGILANVRWSQDRQDEAHALWTEALAISREVGDRTHEAVVSVNLAMWCLGHGRPDEALSLIGGCLQIAREMGNRRQEAELLHKRALVAINTGRLAEARPWFLEALAFARESGNTRIEAFVLEDMSELLIQEGALEEAQRRCDEAARLHASVPDPHREGTSLIRRAMASRFRGDAAAAAADLARAAVLRPERADAAFDVRLLAEQGRQELAAGRSAAGLLARLDERLAREPVHPDMRVLRDRLQAAESARAEGQTLVRGALAEELPPGLLEAASA